MNFYDSEKILALLKEHGYAQTDSPEEADFIAVNACSVRQHAEDRAIAFLSSHQYLRREGKFLCLFGCTANLYGKRLQEKYHFIDIVCGANNYHRLPELLETSKRGVCVTGESEQPFIDLPVIVRGDLHAFVTITKGCENYCTFCVVPFTRGKLVSKNPEDIYKEIESLTGQGIREIILLGQNVNEYRSITGMGFTELLEKIHNINGILRIGFLTSHPKDIPDELLLSFKYLPKLYKHLHLPIQSASNRILKRMNRRYTFERYLEVIAEARQVTRDISITSDIIVGFPSETEEDFEKTCSAIKDIEFDDLFIFKYSPRPDTAASRMKDDVTQEEKERRHQVVQNIQEEISLRRNRRFVGKTDNVFVLKPSGKKENFFLARSSYNKSVLFESKVSQLGRLESVVFNSAGRRYLYGYSCGGCKRQRLSLQDPI